MTDLLTVIDGGSAVALAVVVWYKLQAMDKHLGALAKSTAVIRDRLPRIRAATPVSGVAIRPLDGYSGDMEG